MKSQFLGDKYDKSRLIALYVDEAGKDHPLYYIDVKCYRDKGWISNHFVGAYFFLLQRHFMSANIKFLDTSFWSHYVQPPNNDRGVTIVSKYLSKYGITKDSHFVVPTLISNSHFICFEVDLSTKIISLYDSLGRRNSREIHLLYDVLTLYIEDTEDWTMMDNFAKPSIAGQTDMHSCGFFVCFYALSLATTSDVSSKALGEVDKTKKKIMMSLLDRKIYV
jgi:Ulp1 family protease